MINNFNGLGLILERVTVKLYSTKFAFTRESCWPNCKFVELESTHANLVKSNWL